VQEDEKVKPAGPSINKQQAATQQQTGTRQIENQSARRRERFLTEFTQKPKFKELRNRLKQSIFRISVEKYKKEVSAQNPLSNEDRTKFKANLYILL